MRVTTRRHALRWLATLPVAGAALALGPLAVLAADNAPVTMVVPWAAGGATDVLARGVATRLAQKWSRPVVVENRSGSSGMIGAREVARAKPDGQTLLFTLSSLVQAPHLYPSEHYETILEELAPITTVGSNYLFWVVRTDSPAKTLPELVALVRSDPKTYGSFGSYGAGTTGNVMGLVFSKQANLNLTHIAYRGEPPEITDLLGGHIPMAIISGNAGRPLLNAGKIRVLASTGPERSQLAPDAPTFKELGYTNMDLAGWSAMFAPRGTPPEILERIAKDVKDAVADPALQKIFNDFDIRLAATTPAAFAIDIRRQYEVWGKLIREAAVKGE